MPIDPSRVPNNKKRPLLKRDIETANLHSRSAKEASRYLNVNYSTYKRYAKMYGLFETQKNEAGKGVEKKRTGERLPNAFTLKSIMNNEHPLYDRTKYKKRLIAAGYLVEECAGCGFNKRRVLDNSMPLVLCVKDGDRHNFILENQELRCYNCVYLTTGTVSHSKVLQPDMLNDDLMATGNITLDDIQRMQAEVWDSQEQK